MKEIQISKKTFFIVILVTIALAISACGIAVALNSNMFSPAWEREQISEIRLDNLGSAERPQGNIALVSIFANDLQSKWDFNTENDKKTRSDLFSYMDIAADWFYNQAKSYGKEVKLIYDSDPQSDLYYETSLDLYTKNTYSFDDEDHLVQWQYINENIRFDKIREKYSCENIVYLIFLNTENQNDYSAFAMPIYAKERKYPHEMCFFPIKYSDTVVAPSVIIHEILHCFGAPDLYIADGFGTNYNTTLDFVVHCQENIPNDIMFTTYSYIDGEDQRVFDRITNEITEITAYYIGWLDTPPPEVDEFGLVHNQYENYNG